MRPGVLRGRCLQQGLAHQHQLLGALQAAGFSRHIAAWVSTNLQPLPSAHNGQGGQLVWSFDLDGIAQMYDSYEGSSLWPFLARPQDGISVSFVRAERSAFRWGGGDEAEIMRLGHSVAVLPDAGHWVHTDNPAGLLDLIAPSFGAARPPAQTPAATAQYQ